MKLRLAVLAVSVCTTATPALSTRPLPRQSPSQQGSPPRVRRAELQKRLKSFARPFVQKWCAGCHGGEEPEADLDLPALLTKLPGRGDLGVLLDVRGVLTDREMPPEDEPAPPDPVRERMITWIDEVLAAHKKSIDPGRVTMRRLSRVEYRNTVRDLFGVTTDVTTGFPADDLGYGFDNIGDSLSVSVLHLETYATAARRISEFVFSREDPDNPAMTLLEAEDHPFKGHARVRGDYVVFLSRGHTELPLDLPRDGEYRIHVTAYAQQAGDEPAKMGVGIDGRRLRTVEVDAVGKRPKTYAVQLRLAGGRQNLQLSFLNDYQDRKHPNRRRRDRNLWIDMVRIVGPVDHRPPPPEQAWIRAATPRRGSPARRARAILRVLTTRAWRRPVEDAELARLTDLFRAATAAGDDFAQGMQLALQAVLVSPNFLFRIEPGGFAPRGTSRPALLGDHEIATRLSYFLWSSAPDERLMRLAAEGKLRDADTLAAEARRLLRDHRADAVATNFAAQWLELRSLEEVTPDPDRFPTFTPTLRDAMRRETQLFFRAVLRENREVRDLLGADFTFVNEELARHYGIPGIKGTQMRRVELRDPRRRGLVGHASIQTVTSNPTRTSPVKRGRWILANLLDDPPPPPQPGFDSFKPGTDVEVAATLRAQLALHRKAKACAVCHNRMDPLGLALENYDAIGRWRDSDHGTKIDASGKLPDGRVLQGPADLETVLRRGDAFRRCIAKKLFLFAVGREVRAGDEVVLRDLVRSLGPATTLRDMIVGVVSLDAFRRRNLLKSR